MKGAKVCKCQVIYMDDQGFCHLFLPLFVDTLGVCHPCFEEEHQACTAPECNSAKFRAHIGNTSPVVLSVSQEDQLKERMNLMHSVLDEMVRVVKERKKKAIISSILNQVHGSSRRFAEKIAVKEHDVLSRDLSKNSRPRFSPLARRDHLEDMRCKPKVHRSRMYHLQQPRAVSF